MAPAASYKLRATSHERPTTGTDLSYCVGQLHYRKYDPSTERDCLEMLRHLRRPTPEYLNTRGKCIHRAFFVFLHVFRVGERQAFHHDQQGAECSDHSSGLGTNELGGIRRTVEFIAACARFDVGFRFHSGETGVGSAAYLHVSAALEHVREPSQTLFRWYADDVIAGGPFVPRDGVVPVPAGPGLGVELDRAALRRLHERYRSEGPFPAGPADGAYGGTFRRL